MQYLLFFAILITVIIIAKLFSWPFKVIIKLVINILFGLLIILIINSFAAPIGLYIPFNTITALIAGLLGIPGVILLILLHYII